MIRDMKPKSTAIRLLRAIYPAAFLAAAAGACCAPAEAKTAPRLEFGPDGAFAFLHVTDVQDHAKLSPRSEAVLRAALAATKPGLVVLTGDNVNVGANGAADFAAAMEPLVALFEEFRTPFCVTFGNHDSEKKGEGFLTRQEQYDWLKARGGALFVDHDVPELTGVGSGAVELAAPGAAEPAFRIFVMDSGDYASGGYDGCHADQIAWYESVAADGLPHLWFQHIIVPDANDTGLFRAAKDGEKGIPMRVRGRNVQAVPAEGVLGRLKEHTCPPGRAAYHDAEHTVQGRTLYDAWRANGSLAGAYFGHDHMNSFDGEDENGVRLGATKALTVHSYNDGDPGLRLFVVHEDGSFETETASEKRPFPAPADGAAYRPASPQPLPRVPQGAGAPPVRPAASFAPTPSGEPAPGTRFEPGLLEDYFGSARIVSGPVQALANKKGTVPGSAEARAWESGDVFRYRGQVFAAADGEWRFAERMYDFTTVKLDGDVVFESREWRTADCSGAIPVSAGWHEIEILFENENGRAGAAWPEYNDNGPPSGPGFGMRVGGGDASTDPSGFFFPEDPGDGSLFRVPVMEDPPRR